MREKDFRKYSQARKGLTPRALMLNNAERIIESLLEQQHNRQLQIVEVGFNHGNDSRYLAEVVYSHLRHEGWDFTAYDYEKYFMPENLEMDENIFPGINSCIKAIPCTLEKIYTSDILLPEHIDLFYSSKTLTLCDKDIFYSIMTEICQKISDNGFVMCSLHTKVNDDDTFPAYGELYDMLKGTNPSCKKIFSGFSIVVQPEVSECNFAFIAQKTGLNMIEVCNEVFQNESQNEYVKKAIDEKDTVFVTN